MSLPRTSHRIEPLEPRRLFAAGQLDTTYGTAGHVDLPLGIAPEENLLDLKIARNGDAIVSAAVNVSQSGSGQQAYEVRVFHLHADGSRDLHFGPSGDGQITLPVPQEAFKPGTGGPFLPAIHTHLTSDDGVLVQIGGFLYKFRARVGAAT